MVTPIFKVCLCVCVLVSCCQYVVIIYDSAAVLLQQGLIFSDINNECKCILANHKRNNPFLNKLALQGIDMGVCVWESSTGVLGESHFNLLLDSRWDRAWEETGMSEHTLPTVHVVDQRPAQSLGGTLGTWVLCDKAGHRPGCARHMCKHVPCHRR